MAEFVDDCATIFGVAIARRKVIDTQAWWLAGGFVPSAGWTLRTP
jgi:hypothetical protein